jgi:hypothetical protein
LSSKEAGTHEETAPQTSAEDRGERTRGERTKGTVERAKQSKREPGEQLKELRQEVTALKNALQTLSAQKQVTSSPPAREKKFKLIGNIKTRQNQGSEEKFSVYSAKSRQLLDAGTSDEDGNVDMLIQEEYVYIVLDSEPGRKHRVRADPAYPAKVKQR